MYFHEYIYTLISDVTQFFRTDKLLLRDYAIEHNQKNAMLLCFKIYSIYKFLINWKK